jgi:hypothetical protein
LQGILINLERNAFKGEKSRKNMGYFGRIDSVLPSLFKSQEGAGK